MVRRPPGILAKAFVALLASAWLVDSAQHPAHASAVRQKSGAESPHEGINDALHTATRLAQELESPLVSDRRKSTLSKNNNDKDIDASAIATLAPAEQAVRAPITRRSSIQSTGLAPPQDARDLNDWEVEEIVLLATVDGRLYCRHRRTGQEMWTLEVETPMVEATYHNRNRSALEDDYLPIDHYIWVVEPSRDGSIFIYIPGGKQGLVNTGLTMKSLVEDLSPYADGATSVLYTGEKRTTMVTVDAHTGRVLKWFGAGGAIVNDEASCSVSNHLLDPEGAECSSRGTLTLGRTEYRVDIHGKDDGHPIATLKYSEWQPNNYDHDLHRQYSSTKDGKYVYARHDGGVFAADLNNEHNRKPLFTQKFSSPVARVYDVVRPWGSEDQNPDLVILPQPTPPAGEETLDMRKSTIFLNHTEDGSWYAMSGLAYPSVISGSQQAICDSREWWQHGPLWEDMNDAQLSKALVGLHTIDTARPDPVLTISAPKLESEVIEHDPNSSAVLPIEPQPSNIVRVMKGIPVAAARNVSAFVQNPTILVLLIMFAFFYKNEIVRWLKASYAQKFQKIQPKRWEQPVESPKALNPPEQSEVQKEFDEQGAPLGNDGLPQVADLPAIEEADVKVEDFAPSTDNDAEASPLLPTNNSPNSTNSTDDESSPKQTSLDASTDDISKDTPKKRKPHRGKRGGAKHKKGRKPDLTTSEDHGPKPPATVDDAVKNAKTLGKQANELEPDVFTAPGDVSDVSDPVLRLGSLEVNTDKLIGTGSNGTMVFEGNFDGRDVAVKRMLIQFYDIASQETKLLRESDDHENVIRYYTQQQAGGFLYIALELCPASLADVIEKPQLHRDLAQEGEKDLPGVLYQITNGLQHLHDLRIVHRDLKPQNILVAPGKHGKGPRLLVSDFGLCKKLEGEQSSFRATTAHAAGTSGWRAPELLLDDDIRDGSTTAIEASTHTDGSGPLISSDLLTNRRATRAIDIFSLGLVFYYVLTKGSHPYDCGDRYMREVNIRKGKFNLSALKVLGDYQHEAEDLISSMLQQEPKMRPNARQVLAHPFFWSAKKRLTFLCDVSDHFEKEVRDPPSQPLRTLESYAPELLHMHHNDFLRPLGAQFVDSLGKQRKYTGSRLLDLLRALRNKKNHYEDMTDALKKHLGPLPEGYLSFWTRKFPGLLIACWNVVYEVEWDKEDRFVDYYTPGGNA